MTAANAGGRARQRRKMILVLGALAAAGVASATFAYLPPPSPKARAETGKLALPGLGAKTGDIALITVTTADESYSLLKSGSGWVVPEKDNYPVDPRRIAAVLRAFSRMTLAEPMTRDPNKLDALGLGDPAAGGTGATVAFKTADGRTQAELIAGFRDRRLYVRRSNDPQAWSVETAEPAPPLHRAAGWLDIDPISIAAADIAAVEVKAADGVYRLVPVDADGARFHLAPPDDDRRAGATVAAMAPALALSRLLPTDVMAVTRLDAEKPSAEHTTVLKSGLIIRAKVYRVRGRGWIVLTGDAPAGAPAAASAANLNRRDGGWAYGLSGNDLAAFLTPRRALM